MGSTIKPTTLICPRCRGPVYLSDGRWDDQDLYAYTRSNRPEHLSALFCGACGLSTETVPTVRMAYRLWTMDTKEEWDQFWKDDRDALVFLSGLLEELDTKGCTRDIPWGFIRGEIRSFGPERYDHLLLHLFKLGRGKQEWGKTTPGILGCSEHNLSTLVGVALETYNEWVFERDTLQRMGLTMGDPRVEELTRFRRRQVYDAVETIRKEGR